MQQLLNFTKLTIVILLCNFSACNTVKPPDPVPTLPNFDAGVSVGTIDNADIDEASGLVASRNFKGLFWTHNDSGDKNRIFLINNKGQWQGTFYINGAQNRDWEDIAMNTIAGQNYIYIGDIGDNDASYNNEYTIYKVKEPNTLPNKSDQNIDAAETIKFRYPDASHDAETLMVDQQTSDIYVVTKRENNVRIFILPYPQSTTSTSTLTYVADLPFGAPINGIPTGATAGDISIDNSEIVIKNYFQIFYWKLKKTENIRQALARNHDKLLPYSPEPQGEGIAFATDNTGYYTIGEAGEAHNLVNLNFYKRN
jgi:hypothetical protein